MLFSTAFFIFSAAAGTRICSSNPLLRLRKIAYTHRSFFGSLYHAPAEMYRRTQTSVLSLPEITLTEKEDSPPPKVCTAGFVAHAAIKLLIEKEKEVHPSSFRRNHSF